MSARWLVKLLIGWLIAVAALMLLAATLGPVFFGAATLAGVLLASGRRGWLGPLGEALIGRRGPARWPRWAAALGAYLGVAAAGVAPMQAVFGISALASGAGGIIGPLCWGVLAIAEVFAIIHFTSGDPMSHPLLAKITRNRAAFDAFAGSAGPVMTVRAIDPIALREAILSDVIGQDAIVFDVCEQLATSIDIQAAGRPLGVVMFAGATGAGKTELAKSIAKHAFDGRIINIACNQLTDESKAQTLTGAPLGYQDSQHGGNLTRGIEQMGSGVILLDEIEKAHPAVMSILMGLLDEARLTESSTNRVMDASKFFIVLTTNAEHEKLAQLAATINDPIDLRRAVKDTLRAHFKPEQLARVNEIYTFGRIGREDMGAVAVKLLDGFARDAGVELVGVDGALVVDAVTKHEQLANYGIREVIGLLRREVMRGMVQRRKEGFKEVGIVCQGDAVEVVGLPAPAAAGRGAGARRQEAAT